MVTMRSTLGMYPERNVEQSGFYLAPVPPENEEIPDVP